MDPNTATDDPPSVYECSDVITFENGEPRELTAEEREQLGMSDEFNAQE